MSNVFRLDQSNTGLIQLGKLSVPGCGRNEKDDAPVILCEIEGKNITLFVYGDINSKEPTHQISLNDARVAVKKAAADG